MQWDGGVSVLDFDDVTQFLSEVARTDGWPWSHLSLLRLVVPDDDDAPSDVTCCLSMSMDTVAVIMVVLAALNPLPDKEELLSLAVATARIVTRSEAPALPNDWQRSMVTEWHALCWRQLWPEGAAPPSSLVRYPPGRIPLPAPGVAAKTVQRTRKRRRPLVPEDPEVGVHGVRTPTAAESRTRAQEIMALHATEARRARSGVTFSARWQPPPAANAGSGVMADIARLNRWNAWRVRAQHARCRRIS